LRIKGLISSYVVLTDICRQEDINLEFTKVRGLQLNNLESRTFTFAFSDSSKDITIDEIRINYSKFQTFNFRNRKFSSKYKAYIGMCCIIGSPNIQFSLVKIRTLKLIYFLELFDLTDSLIESIEFLDFKTKQGVYLNN